VPEEVFHGMTDRLFCLLAIEIEWLPWLTNPVVLLSATIAVSTGCLLLGRALALRGRGRLKKQLAVLQDKVVRSEAQARDSSRMVARMQGEQGTVANLALSLPGVVRELNRGDLDPRAVPPLILNLAEAVFQPGYVLLYIARAGSKREDAGPVLQLVRQQGYAEIPASLKTIPFGSGKIGWVAQQKLDMLKEDWINLARTEGTSIQDNHPSACLDISGPLVHHLVSGEQVLGVLCIGSPKIRPRNEKLMFQLVTNLGALALVNARHVTKLKDLANTDGLTALLNKRYFMSELANLIIAAEREAQRLSLFIFDIDHFKTYNDTNGHLEGDRVLRQLAALFKQQVRPADRCCRYGGEEFILAMPDTEAKDALVVAERIRKAIEDFRFDNQEKQPGGNLTISGGVASFPADGTSVLEITTNADRALYESKRAGRNRISRYRGVQIGQAEDEAAIDISAETDVQIDVRR
jgi:diguanylate cyclase (GGDEF)-like protein